MRAPKKEERYFAITNVQTINFQSTEGSKYRVLFEDLTPLYPEEKIALEFLDGTKSTLSGRVIDIVSPLGKGQRALVVAPPRTGTTAAFDEPPPRPAAIGIFFFICIFANFKESLIVLM